MEQCKPPLGQTQCGAAALLPPSAPPSCAGQSRAMPWQASSGRTVKSTMASRVGSVLRTSKRNADQNMGPGGLATPGTGRCPRAPTNNTIRCWRSGRTVG
eukprot:scaffold21997_cov105-Phaeocystis_antarctica.AAC.1